MRQNVHNREMSSFSFFTYARDNLRISSRYFRYVILSGCIVAATLEQKFADVAFTLTSEKFRIIAGR